MARATEEKDSHRHLIPGGIPTGGPEPTEGGHTHSLASGDSKTSVDPGNSTDNHRHTANGQGTSGPVNTMNDTQGTGPNEVKESK